MINKIKLKYFSNYVMKMMMDILMKKISKIFFQKILPIKKN